MHVFSLQEAVNRGIDRFSIVGQSQIIELVFINGVLAPYALFYSDENNIYRLPIIGIEPNVPTFTFINGVKTYSEYFESYIIPELLAKVSKMKKQHR
jgi:hypothetical protein